MAEKHLTGN